MTLLQAECHELLEAAPEVEGIAFNSQPEMGPFFINAQFKFIWVADEDVDKEEEKEVDDDNGNINAVRVENIGIFIGRDVLLSNEDLTIVMNKILSCAQQLADRANLPDNICMALEVCCYLESSEEVSAVKEASSKFFLSRRVVSIKVQDNEVGVDQRARTCAICLEDMATGTLATQMDCSHFFHHCCISTWLAKSSSCPLCRCPGARIAIFGGIEIIAYVI